MKIYVGIDMAKDKFDYCAMDDTFNILCRGINGTMDRSVRGYPLPVKSIRRNIRISKIRSAVEHPYAFFKGMFRFGHVMVTTVQRVRV